MNWLASYRYLRALRKGGESERALTDLQKASIPFLIVALKIPHAPPPPPPPELQQFESLVADKAGCLGPLDLLLELATRCADNVWNAGSHHLSRPGERERGA